MIVNGKMMTLNTIEHDVIRPKFKDPRCQFALVCASKGCPSLRSEAYEGSFLDRHLDDQAMLFVVDPFRNEFDPAKKHAEISKT